MPPSEPILKHPGRLPEGAGDERRRAPVRPTDAATLILLRARSDGGHEVLMGQRARRHSFMPGAYVFPGGKVDRADAAIRPADRMARDTERYLTTVASAAKVRAIANTAVRETYEETGLLLAEPGDLGRPTDATWEDLKAKGLAPAHRHLRYLGRAITPPESPIRFHARFLIADAAHAHGDLGGSGELLNLHWVPLEEALALPMADVTEFMLGELDRYLGLTAKARAKRPLFGYRNGRAMVRYL